MTHNDTFAEAGDAINDAVDGVIHRAGNAGLAAMNALDAGQ